MTDPVPDIARSLMAQRDKAEKERDWARDLAVALESELAATKPAADALLTFLGRTSKGAPVWLSTSKEAWEISRRVFTVVADYRAYREATK